MAKEDRTEKIARPESEEKLGAILTICQRMSSERDLAKLLDLIAREAARLLSADRSTIFLLDEEKKQLWSWVALGSEEIRFDARLGIAGAVAMGGDIINVEDTSQDPRFYGDVDDQSGYRTHTILAVPLRNYAGEIVGTFEVLNKKKGCFTADDQEMLQALAANAAISIETAQLVEQLRTQRDQLLEQNTSLWREVEGSFATQNILGTSPKVQDVVRLIEQISDSDATVLITGESGTGKELVAKAIHHSSPRARCPLVTLNCAALPDHLLEAELFGIEKGIATGVERRPGKFELADGGTLFLDEIGDLSLAAQAKILRALQEKIIERVGGRKSIPVDVRILSATNKDLAEGIKTEDFREDLYYRLKVIHIKMPSLREVRADIPLLVNHFLSEYSSEMKKDGMELAESAMQALSGYSWPGNVRELENEIKRLVASTRKRVVAIEDLSENIQESGKFGSPVSGSMKDLVADAVEQMERKIILEALKECGNNQARAAKHLGLSRQGLIKKMKRYGLK